VKFIPPTEEEEKDKEKLRKEIREGDLKGHMENDTSAADQGKPAADSKEIDKKAKEILEKDNQVRQALQLLQTWHIFSQMRVRE